MSFIGVIDSGVGGLTILRQLRQLHPYSYCYLADHAFCPYGTKSNKVVLERTNRLVDYLQSRGAQAVVLACNTMSTFAEQLRARYSLSIYDVITPTCNAVVARNPNTKRVALLATRSTVNNGAYRTVLSRYGIEVVDFDCSSFVPYVERCETENKACVDTVEKCLHNLPNVKADAVVLGCTHFPLLRSQISNYCKSADIIECCCPLPDDLFVSSSGSNVTYLTTGDVALAGTASAWYGDVEFTHITL